MFRIANQTIVPISAAPAPYSTARQNVPPPPCNRCAHAGQNSCPPRSKYSSSGRWQLAQAGGAAGPGISTLSNCIPEPSSTPMPVTLQQGVARPNASKPPSNPDARWGKVRAMSRSRAVLAALLLATGAGCGGNAGGQSGAAGSGSGGASRGGAGGTGAGGDSGAAGASGGAAATAGTGGGGAGGSAAGTSGPAGAGGQAGTAGSSAGSGGAAGRGGSGAVAGRGGS